MEARQASRGGRRAANGSPAGPRSRGNASTAGRKKRFIDYPRFGRTGVRRWLPSFKQILSMVLFFFASLIGLAALAYAMVEVPDPNADTTFQSNVYYYSDGKTEIGRKGDVNRQNVTVDQIPMHVQKAVIAAENRSFYTDSGVSPKGLLRAGVTMVKGGATQGGSTITQQYVKNAYLSQERTLKRKFSEIFIALKVDRQMRKDDILVGYLNTSYFVRGACGIQAAAQAYYGKNVGELNVAEGAYLATVLNAPGIYDVVEFPSQLENVKGRWSYALGGMVKEGWLTQEERDKLQFPMPIKPKPALSNAGQAGYMMKVTNQYLDANDIIPEADLARGGYRIVTTFEKPKQDAAVAAVDEQLTKVLKPKENQADRYVRTGLASIVPGDGAVVALYGGADFVKQEYNDAIRRDIQAGSTFKLFVLAAALRNGGADGKPIGPDSLYNGDNRIPIVQRDGTNYKASDGKEYQPPNEGEKDYGPITLTKAMESSVNTVFVQLAADVGPENVKQAAIDAGLPDNLIDFDPTPTMALGVAPPSALDMAEAYATFAARGLHVEPYFVKEVTHNGAKMDMPEHEKKQIFDKNLADTVNQVMMSVVENGSGRAAKELDRQVGGKTGTTDENKSAWFVGYTPQLATAVALFREDPTSHERLSLTGLGGGGSVHGSGVPAKTWTEYMSRALGNLPKAEFPLPSEEFEKVDDKKLPPTTAPPVTRAPATTTPPTTAPPVTTTPPPDRPTFPIPTTGNTGGNNNGSSNGNGWPGNTRPPSTRPPATETAGGGETTGSTGDPEGDSSSAGGGSGGGGASVSGSGSGSEGNNRSGLIIGGSGG